MAALIIVKLFRPESLFSGYAVIVGVVLFFIVEAVDKTPDNESQVRFSTIINDLKKPQVLLWVLLPIIITIVQIVCGKVFAEDSYRSYIDHVIGRTSLEMDLSNLLKWGLTDVIFVLGEEIPFVDFYAGRAQKCFQNQSAYLSQLFFFLQVMLRQVIRLSFSLICWEFSLMPSCMPGYSINLKTVS